MPSHPLVCILLILHLSTYAPPPPFFFPQNSTSGHKYGLAAPGVGWALWRNKKVLPEELVFHVNYLGSDQASFTINFSKSASQVGFSFCILRCRLVVLVFHPVPARTRSGRERLVDTRHEPLSKLC